MNEEALYFGDLARAMGYATADQILECLKLQQAEDAAGKPHRKIGELLLAQGYLTQEQLRELLELL